MWEKSGGRESFIEADNASSILQLLPLLPYNTTVDFYWKAYGMKMEDYAPVEKLKHFKRRYACVSGRQVFKELSCSSNCKREAGYGGSLVGPETRHQLEQEYAHNHHHHQF